MDVRIEEFAALGLAAGDAHVLRNAGGIVTDDTIRSLAVSQRLLGTRSVLVVHHTDCGLEGLDGASFRQRLYETAGQFPGWEVSGFVDVDVRESVRRIVQSPFLEHRDQVYGFVLDVATGRLREVR